jgi:hypothetical protein
MTAAIYARKSNDQTGVADDAKSVTRQIDHARQYATGKGWVVADGHIYVDDGICGAEFANRPGFVRLTAERDAFLRDACVDDDALERDVRSLVAAHEQAGSYLESPAIDVAARALALAPRHDTSESAGSLTGQTVSHYRIVGKVGAGGMDI